MGKLFGVLAVAGVVGCSAVSETGTKSSPDMNTDGAVSLPLMDDADGDSIGDDHEGRKQGRDTDSDGTPD